jgi:hypothetical protein
MAFFRRYNFIVLSSAICLAFFIPALASATSPALEGLDTTAGVGYNGSQTAIGQDLPSIIGKVVGSVLALIGVIFLVLMIYGGIMWMTARGNDQQVEKAKSLIGAAVIGLVIVLAAYAITSFIGKELLG